MWLSTEPGAGESVREEVAEGSSSPILYALQAMGRRLFFFPRSIEEPLKGCE